MPESRGPLGTSSLGDGAEEAQGVRVPRLSVDVVGGRLLDNLPGVHDVDPARVPGHQAHVVGDENHGEAALLAQALDELEYLRLDRDVDRSGGFVGDEQLRLAGQRHGNHDALAHSAAQPGEGSL